jgi:hypothetical protein
MSYFFSGDHQALIIAPGQLVNATPELQQVYSKFFGLHTALYPRIRNHALDLHPRWQKQSVVSPETAATLAPTTSIALTYFRSREQAEVIERRAGKEYRSPNTTVEAFRHPVIELRITPEHVAVELVLSPYAAWDQKNLIGKLEIAEHRAAFRKLVRDLGSEYRLGFWDGIHLDDMHLTSGELARGRALDEWMKTFADSADWLRIGKWYTPDAPELDEANIVNELFGTIKALHSVYDFLLWTSNNDFHHFYEKKVKPSFRRVAVAS